MLDFDKVLNIYVYVYIYSSIMKKIIKELKKKLGREERERSEEQLVEFDGRDSQE